MTTRLAEAVALVAVVDPITAAVGSGLAVFAALLVRLFTQVGSDQQTLLDRYRDDIAARDAAIELREARIDTLEHEVVELRIALDLCRRGIIDS